MRYRPPLPSLRSLLMLCAAAISLVIISRTPATAQDAPYADQLVQRAQQLKLSEDREWRTLLHYAKSILGTSRSRIGDDHFFLSPQGRTAPRAELEATIRSLFIPATDGEHSACRFPARYEYLKKALSIDPAQLPSFSCTERDKIFAGVDARSAVLVFPVGHINSPASMFGHTLLRIDSSSGSSLISYAANYAAVTTDANGFAYAWKGLSGRYSGYYSFMPYYQKVKEYNDLEHRDMWEYPLKLSQGEVQTMVNHLWELQNISSPYYFLDENCSYNLLFIIEAARPQLHLTDRTGLFVLPTDTIRVTRESGILGAPRYRPSQGTRIRKAISLLDQKGQETALALALSKEDPAEVAKRPVPDAEKMQMLDLAAEYLQFRLSREEIAKEEYTRVYFKLLSARSRLGAAPAGTYDITPPAAPESGHHSSKVGFGPALRRGHLLAELDFQPEFHSLLDPDQGYLRGAQIKFFDTALWYDFPADEVRVKRLHLLDIVSISPRDLFFRPLSWRVNTGFATEGMRNGRDSLIYRVNSGGGLAYPSPFGGILYGLAELDVNLGRQIRATITAGPGVTLGAMEQLTDWWKVHLFARGFIYEVGDDRQTVKVVAQQNFRVSQNNSVSVEYAREYLNGHPIEEASGLWNFYF